MQKTRNVERRRENVDDDTSTDDEVQYPIIRLDERIVAVHPVRISSNGNAYTALKLPSDDLVFIWEYQQHWRQEIKDHRQDYIGLDAHIWVRDKEPNPEEHFYNFEAIAAARPSVSQRFLRRHIREDPAGRDPPDMESDLTHEEADIRLGNVPPVCRRCDSQMVQTGRRHYTCVRCGRSASGRGDTSTPP